MTSLPILVTITGGSSREIFFCASQRNMKQKLLALKPIDLIMKESEGGEHKLARTLTATHLVLLGIGAIIGAGIFVLTGQAAASYAGPAIILSFVISGIACAFAGLCYAEFASMIPIAGSAYTYAYATLGELMAWIIGWDLILEYLFASSTVAVGWSGYVVSFLKDFGIVFPASLCNAPFTTEPGQIAGLVNLPAMFIVAIVTVLLVVGIKESANFNSLVVFLKVSVVLAFLFLGYKFINPENWTPFIPENTGEFGKFGYSGILRGSAVVFFAYIGFDAVSTAAQEAINPQRDMPIGILGSLAACTILYILVSLVLTGIVSYKLLNVPDPIAVGIDAAGPTLVWFRPFIKAGAIAGLSSVILVMLMGQPRIFYAMANDGLLPAVFGKVHPRFKTPHLATIITGVFAMVLAGIFPIGILGELVSIGTLLAFALVCAGVLILRYSRPEIDRPFKTPLVPFVPVMGVLCALIQMIALPGATWIRLLIWLAIGLTIYFTFGINNSKLHPALQNAQK